MQFIFITLIFRNPSGPVLSVMTNLGEINLQGGCRSRTSHFYTAFGRMSLGALYSNVSIIVTEHAEVDFNLLEGSVTCLAPAGQIYAFIDKIDKHSRIEVKLKIASKTIHFKISEQTMYY